jgi:hypothetical protein
MPVSAWTLEKEGTAKVKIAGVDDKQETTGVVVASLTVKIFYRCSCYTLV